MHLLLSNNDLSAALPVVLTVAHSDNTGIVSGIAHGVSFGHNSKLHFCNSPVVALQFVHVSQVNNASHGGQHATTYQGIWTEGSCATEAQN